MGHNIVLFKSLSTSRKAMIDSDNFKVLQFKDLQHEQT